jgi:ubiquitin-protein ligase
MTDIKKIKELMEYLTKNENVPLNKVEIIDNNDLLWKVIFDGPEESLYEYGIFILGQDLSLRFYTNIDPDNDKHVFINLYNK